ncbi:hypothetical protein GCM10010387_04940 [Streptomyces inusitatus]|uniref:Uncharacterized protein n=1 Tax=Streptomyces inusitatus TaxID=68221 RepID=A0A918PMV3_9ACTN|nr:hypothetical protein GCM10010387_04940 [Streptomyces inusitatus]
MSSRSTGSTATAASGTPEASESRRADAGPTAAGPSSSTPGELFPVRRHRPAAERPRIQGFPLVTLVLIITVPAVLAAVMLRPRRSRG